MDIKVSILCNYYFLIHGLKGGGAIGVIERNKININRKGVCVEKKDTYQWFKV